jgi:hypothetical protein
MHEDWILERGIDMNTVLRIGVFALLASGTSLLSMAGCTTGAESEPGTAEEGPDIGETQTPLQTGVHYYIRAKHSGKCLHQHGATYGNGDPITQWDCVDQPNVQWKLEMSSEANRYFIKVRHSGKCAHQHGATYENGDAITQWDCIEQPNVRWSFIPAGGDYYYIKVQHSGKCMHVHGGGNDNGAAITQWECINAPNVLWSLDPVGH